MEIFLFSFLQPYIYIYIRPVNAGNLGLSDSQGLFIRKFLIYPYTAEHNIIQNSLPRKSTYESLIQRFTEVLLPHIYSVKIHCIRIFPHVLLKIYPYANFIVFFFVFPHFPCIFHALFSLSEKILV